MAQKVLSMMMMMMMMMMMIMIRELILTGSALTEVTFSNDQTSLETYFCR
jgi:hypothetical protein